MNRQADKKEILRARAQALASEPERRENAEETLQVIEFLLAHENYAIESGVIREVYALKDLTPLPCTPPFVVGMVNVRGQILTVIDIKEFFGLPRKGLTDLNKVIIVRAGNMELGFLADAVLGVRSVPLADIQPSLPTLTGVRAEYLRGVTPERLIILDVSAILSDPKIIVDEDVEP
ncbi:MAG: purine-binding chemotaxis protein CheW [Armatimonadetes bacterium]|nr:purine-binding chemotaxis protein CheW [Armatimonadota bacterium]